MISCNCSNAELVQVCTFYRRQCRREKSSQKNIYILFLLTNSLWGLHFRGPNLLAPHLLLFETPIRTTARLREDSGLLTPGLALTPAWHMKCRSKKKTLTFLCKSVEAMVRT